MKRSSKLKKQIILAVISVAVLLGGLVVSIGLVRRTQLLQSQASIKSKRAEGELCWYPNTRCAEGLHCEYFGTVPRRGRCKPNQNQPISTGQSCNNTLLCPASQSCCPAGKPFCSSQTVFASGENGVCYTIYGHTEQPFCTPEECYQQANPYGFPKGCKHCSYSLVGLYNHSDNSPPLSADQCGEELCYSNEALDIYSCTPKGCAPNSFRCLNVDTYCQPVHASIGWIGIAGANTPSGEGRVPVLSWEEKKIGPFDFNLKPMQSQYRTPEMGKCAITAIKGSKWMKTGDVEQDGTAREGLYILTYTDEELQKSKPGQWLRFNLPGPIIPRATKSSKQGGAYRILVNGEVVCPEAYENNALGQYTSQFYNSLSDRSHTGTWAIPKVRCAGNGQAPFSVVDYKIPKGAGRLTVTAEMTDSENKWYDLSEGCKPLVIDVGKGYGSP